MVEAPGSRNGSNGGAGTPTATAPASAAGAVAELATEDVAAAAAQAGIGLQLVSSVLHGGDAGVLRPLLLAMLRPVLLLQELSGPNLQQLASEAKSAFVLLKYVPYCPGEESAVVGAVRGACGSSYWSSRAAGLVYLQCFWFRHCFLLGSRDMAQVQQLVLQRLQDQQVEVRHLAAATLSGILKGLPPAEVIAVREQLMSQALAIFGPPPGSGMRRKRGAAAAADGGGGAGGSKAAQACIQGLKAFVMSSPYDCPGWMPGVLMALVAATGARHPQVRGDASKALSEFRRTHEQDALEELKRQLEEEQWEALQQVTSSASYFV